MKKTFTFLIVLLFVITSNAQVNYKTLFDFEDGVDTTIWMPFANGLGTKKDLNVVLNPLPGNVNNTDSVLMMRLLIGAESWVGLYVDLDTLEIEDVYGAIGFDDDVYMMSMMVNKPIESSVRIKLERSTTGSPVFTVADTNTVVNEWELLEFNFSEKKGQFFQRVTLFPDDTPKAARTEELVVYMDNVAIQNLNNTSIKEFEGAEMKIYPNPADFRIAVVYPGMTGVKLSNVSGQEIRTVQFGMTNSKVIEIGDLKPGMYFATALTSKGNFTMQFMKK
ncbi:MAG: T9SS type A sorting domain-containing protein [Draconibacterium sp.]